ncbi:MAG TPA: hypothetical protein GX742_00255 [Acholeplasmataceae bacterium]|nr:hypothetical protein [Acholeplasmataceae bacterium]
MNKYNKDLFEMKKAIDTGKAAQATQALPFILEDLTNQIAVQNEILQNEIDQKNRYDKRSKILVVAVLTSLTSTIANIIVLLSK